MRSSAVSASSQAAASQYNNLRLDAQAASYLLAHEQSSPNMTLYIEAGTVNINGTLAYYAGGNTPTITAPVSNNRIDLVTIDSAGTIAITTGVSGASPAAPSVPAGVIPIAYVYVRSTSTTLRDTDGGSATGYIYHDVRPFLYLPAAQTPDLILATIFETAGRFETAVSGGSVTWTSQDGVTLDTTSTTTRYASVDCISSTGGSSAIYGGSPRWGCTANINIKGTTGQMFFGIGDPTVAGSGITFTDDHIGFKIIVAASVASLYATQATGGVETASSALTTIASNETIDMYFQVNGTASVDYYWRKAVGAKSTATNLASNVPTASGYLRGWIKAAVSNASTATQQNISVGGANYVR